MPAEVLRARDEIDAARRTLRARGWSTMSPGWKTLLAARGIKTGVIVGDRRKSWDVLKTLELLEQHVPKDAAVLDIGCYGSEVVCSLPQLGYRDVHGLDLDPGVARMPFRDRIDYRVGDFMNPPFAPGSLHAVTAISVIEHGFDRRRLLGAMSRLLAPGGWFVASFDYWPEKIDTRGILLFGMDWTIFSAAEIEALVEEAARFGLQPGGPLKLAAGERVIHYAGRSYTFGWLALERDASPAVADAPA